MDEQLYIVQRMGTFPVTEDERQTGQMPAGLDEYKDVIAEFGPLPRAQAKKLAFLIAETGDDVEVWRVGDKQSIATIWDGRLFVSEQYDDEGNKLSEDERFSFWRDDDE